jgi:hypothetical protein
MLEPMRSPSAWGQISRRLSQKKKRLFFEIEAALVKHIEQCRAIVMADLADAEPVVLDGAKPP